MSDYDIYDDFNWKNPYGLHVFTKIFSALSASHYHSSFESVLLQLTGMKWVFKHHELQMFGHILNRYG